jgi:hypothetical protein
MVMQEEGSHLYVPLNSIGPVLSRGGGRPGGAVLLTSDCAILKQDTSICITLFDTDTRGFNPETPS